MNDGIIKGTGNSRYLKSAISDETTWEQMREMLITGTLPIDFNGINAAGWEQIGTPNDTAHLLSDETALAIGFKQEDEPTVNGAFLKLANRQPGGYDTYQMFRRGHF